MARFDIDSQREDFRTYLENQGIMEFFTKSLACLCEQTPRPENGLYFIQKMMAGADVQALNSKIRQLEDRVHFLTQKLELNGIKLETNDEKISNENSKDKLDPEKPELHENGLEVSDKLDQIDLGQEAVSDSDEKKDAED